MNQEIPRRFPAAAQDRIVYLNQQLLDPQVHYIVAFEARMDENRLKRSVRLAMDAEPVFGCRYVPGRPPHWKRRDDLDTLSACEVVETSDVQQEVSRFAARFCDAASDPIVQARIFRGSADTLCLKISHVAADGAGGQELLYLIASLYRSLQDPSYRMAPNLGSRSRMQLFRQAGLGECWRALRNIRRQSVENLWRFPSNNREETGGRMYSARRLEPPRFDTLRRHARQFGATLNDVFVAAYFRSLWEFLDFPAGVPQAIVLPMNLRRYLPSGKAEAICNFTAPLLPSLARVPGEPFEGTLQRVRERTLNSEERKQRALVASLAISLGGRLALPRIKKKVDAERRKNVADGRTTAFLSNNGAFDPEQLDFGIPVKDGYQILPTAFAPGLFLAIMSFRKTLHFTISYSSVAMNRDDVERFLDLFLKQLPDSA